MGLGKIDFRQINESGDICFCFSQTQLFLQHPDEIE